MNVQHEIEFFVDGIAVRTEYPKLPAKEVLRLASEESGRCLYDRVLVSPEGTEFINLNLPVMPRTASRWSTRRAR